MLIWNTSHSLSEVIHCVHEETVTLDNTIEMANPNAS